jgi:putative phosphoesterase
MKVALIGNIHANLPALEAVLAHADEQGVEVFWNVGDAVGYGAFPNEVVRWLKNNSIPSTSGSFDRQMLRFKKRKDKWRKKKDLEQYVALTWAYEQLSKRRRKYLRFLSTEIRMQVKGKRVLLTHAGSDSKWEPLTADTSRKHLRQVAQEAKADVIAYGHSHHTALRRVSNVLFINPGSVGLPYDGDPRASYALLRFGPESIEVRRHRVAYDVERTVAAIRDSGLPEAFAQMFLQGRDLDTIKRSLAK